MNLRTETSIEIPRGAAELFDYTGDPASFPAMLQPAGIIPGVVRAEKLDGEQAEGTRRRLEMSDGAVLIEEVLAFDRPARHRYQWKHPKFPFSLLVASGEGDWIFTKLSTQRTRIDWAYTFELTSPLAYPLAWVVVALFRRWMAESLARVDGLMPKS